MSAFCVLQQRLAWLGSVCPDSACFLVKHWTPPVYSTLAPSGLFYCSCPIKADTQFTTNGEWKTSAGAFWTCCKQELMMQSAVVVFAFFASLARSGLVRPAGYGTWSRRRRWRGWRSRAAWIHRGTGQDRLAGSACHSNSRGERRQQLVPFSFTGSRLLIAVRKLNPYDQFNSALILI